MAQIIEGKMGGQTSWVDDAADLNDASTLFEEAHCLFSRNIIKVRADLSQCEAELRKASDEEKALRLLCSQKEEELKVLRADLAKVQKNEAELDKQVTMILKEYGLLGLTAETNTLMSQLQQKLEIIWQLRGEVDQVKADCHQWKGNMDQLAADKEAALAQLASAETQLQGIKVKNLAHAKKIEELEEKLAKVGAEVAEAKGEVEKTKATADKAIAVYLKDAEVVQAKLREASDRKKYAVSGSEGGGDEEGVPEEEEVPKDTTPKDVVPEGVAPEDVASK
ncbi:uncharacterized protein [Nicotiana sylvestris]|uniref:uncharacterized protein n=1 Tax=Nicotiana sylvestris TaxID=4096 RepID=UPI00388C83F2